MKELSTSLTRRLPELVKSVRTTEYLFLSALVQDMSALLAPSRAIRTTLNLISIALFTATNSTSPSPSGEGISCFIRRAHPGDAEGIIDSHSRSIQENCKDDYTTEEIRAWSGHKRKPESWRQSIERDLIWVVEKANVIEGFSQLAFMSETSAEILGLYLSKKVTGLGIGKALFQLMKREAENQNIMKIDLLATLTAKNFYLHMGCYEVIGMHSITIGGASIPCVPMMYKFS